MSQLQTMLSKGTEKYFQPSDPMKTDSVLQMRLAFLVGLVAFGLPIILAGGAVFGGSCFRDSISHFYYAQFLGPVFVGFLVFIGGFLIAYTGDHWLEDLGSFIAGIGACFVAIFPTSKSGCEMPDSFPSRIFADVNQTPPPVLSDPDAQAFFTLFSGAPNLHLWAAGVLFVYLGLYCLFVLRRVVPERHVKQGQMIETKRRRNVLYALCGITILLCVLILGIAALTGVSDHAGWKSYNLTFFIEAVALWAFGLAWFAKGRTFPKLRDPAP